MNVQFNAWRTSYSNFTFGNFRIFFRLECLGLVSIQRYEKLTMCAVWYIIDLCSISNKFSKNIWGAQFTCRKIIHIKRYHKISFSFHLLITVVFIYYEVQCIVLACILGYHLWIANPVERERSAYELLEISIRFKIPGSPFINDVYMLKEGKKIII